MSGEGEDYSDDEIDELFDAIQDAIDEYDSEDGTGAGGEDMDVQITTTARIEWAGEYANNGRNGTRTTTMAAMNLAPVRDAVRRAQKLEGLAARGPLRSYRAKGWHAQLRHLQGTKRGREALEAAGWNPSRETQRRYGRGTQAPSKANRAKITEAYDAARNPGRGWGEARRAAVDALTNATRQYGGGFPVRFRDIDEMRFRP